MTVVVAAVLECKAGPCSKRSRSWLRYAGCSAGCAFQGTPETQQHPCCAVRQKQAVENGLPKYFLWAKHICWSVNLRAAYVDPRFLGASNS